MILSLNKRVRWVETSWFGFSSHYLSLTLLSCSLVSLCVMYLWFYEACETFRRFLSEFFCKKEIDLTRFLGEVNNSDKWGVYQVSLEMLSLPYLSLLEFLQSSEESALEKFWFLVFVSKLSMLVRLWFACCSLVTTYQFLMLVLTVNCNVPLFCNVPFPFLLKGEASLFISEPFFEFKHAEL